MKLFAKTWAAALLVVTWAPAVPAQQPVTLAFSTLDTEIGRASCRERVYVLV